MSKQQKKMVKALFPLLDWTEENEEMLEKQWEDFKATVDTYWDQMRDLRKTMIEAQKEAWNKVFPKLLDVQENLASALPQKLPGMPEGTMTPKEAAGKVREMQEMANQHAMEQVETVNDFVNQGEDKAKELVKEAVQTVETNVKKTIKGSEEK